MRICRNFSAMRYGVSLMIPLLESRRFVSSSERLVLNSMKTGIVVHGYHLQAAGWDHVMWGDGSNNSMGRLPHLVKLASQENPSMIVFSTGASEKDGKIEGQYIFDYLIRRWHDLKDFKDAFDNIDLIALKEQIINCCVVNTDSMNTKQELMFAGNLFAAQGIQRVILVSSPTHLPRCLRDASVIWTKDSAWSPSVLLCSPSDTNYLGCTAGDVAVIEPPHRGDRDLRLDSLPLNKLINRVFHLKDVDRHSFQKALYKLLNKYE